MIKRIKLHKWFRTHLVNKEIQRIMDELINVINEHSRVVTLHVEKLLKDKKGGLYKCLKQTNL